MPSEIERWSEVPYYVQLAGILRERITAGDFAPGQALPSEAALMRTYSVSRGTVRQALGLLRRAGYIQTVPVRGSRVLPRAGWRPGTF